MTCSIRPSPIQYCLKFDLHFLYFGKKICSIFFKVILRCVGGLNMARGFFIFLVFICKPSIWQMVKKEHPRLARMLRQKEKSDFECIELKPLDVIEMDKPKFKDNANCIDFLSIGSIEQI